jgi:phage terminase small subunit
MASLLLTNDNIMAEIQRLIALRAEKVGIDAEWVLKNLVEVANRCMQGVPVLDKEGNPTGEWKFEPNAANRSLELLGKHIGMFAEKIQTDNKTTIGFEQSLLDLIKKRD